MCMKYVSRTRITHRYAHWDGNCLVADDPSVSIKAPQAREFLKDCAEALCKCKPGKAAVLVGGSALLEEGTVYIKPLTD